MIVRLPAARAAVLAPIGFICDHIEVLYDLDREAADVCKKLGVNMVRAATVNDDPHFLDMTAAVVMETIERFRRFPPLPITANAQDLEAVQHARMTSAGK